MDPFTQRMLARSKARRENRDAQLINAGLAATMQRSPLQDCNRMQLLKLTTEVEVTVTKSGAESIASNVNVMPSKVESVNTHLDESVEDMPKENISVAISEMKQDCTSAVRDSARSRLRRLGALYADSQLSSPIHQTEGHFSAEQNEMESQEDAEATHLKVGKSGARLARLAVLAENIRHWEDDLSHPTAVVSHDSQSPNTGSPVHDHSSGAENSKILSKLNHDQQPSTVAQEVPKIKKCMLDESIVATLEAQGFSRTQSKSRLVYDYSKHSSQGNGNGGVLPVKTRSIAAPSSSSKHEDKLVTVQSDISVTPDDAVKLLPIQSPQTPVMGMKSLHSSSNSKLSCSPDKRSVLLKSAGSPRVPNMPQMGLRVGSPHRGDSSPKTGSVLHKAALFESSPTKKTGKDPAELPVSERRAMFERKDGQALIPKAAFSMPVPAKYLADHNDGQRNMSNKVVSPVKGNGRVGSAGTQLQGSVTADDNPKKISPSGKGSGCTGKQAHRSNVITAAPSSAVSADGLPARSSKALAQMFEHGDAITADKTSIKSMQSERQKEIEMLLNRWNKNKECASSGDRSVTVDTAGSRPAVPDTHMEHESSGPPNPPPLPTLTNLLPTQRNESASHISPSKTSQDSHMSPLKQSSLECSNVRNSSSPDKRHKAANLRQQYAEVTDMKRIKVSPPKPGCLYPCLSDIEATTETESEVPDESISDMDSSSENMGNSSFGREILKAAGIHRPANVTKQGQASFSSSSDDESAVLEDIDDFLDEALGADSDLEASPSPAKKTKDNHRSPQRGCNDKAKKQLYSTPSTSQSHSFKYSRGPPVHEAEPDSVSKEVQHVPTFVVEGNEQVPLMHTVSFYRRQQNMTVKGTPVRHIVRQPELETGNVLDKVQVEPDEGAVRNKIAELVDEVSKQQTVISQASQALNLCCSTVEFSGSAEQVEGERLLLVATHRRQAALHEIQRLKVEGSLRPAGYSSELTEQGSLIITNITLPLKKDYLRTMAAGEQCHHFVCMVHTQEQVVASPVVAATSENLRQGGGAALVFPGSLRLDGLYSDFKVTLEIYSLQTNREVLPHDIKYHISGKKDGSGNKLRLTPKKLLKQESRLLMPSIHSPAGPSAVRSPSFQMSGYVVFSLRELRRSQFTLNKVAYSSPLEGNIHLQLSSELQLDVRERGFLTMFEDVSGFGAWHRRWCLLEGATLSYWKYPDDEKKKVPIGQIDLNICTTDTAGLVSRDICARPHTFLLETTRPSQPEDENSLVLVRRGTHTTIRHLLSADTREDRLLWCMQLNKALAMLRAWGRKGSNP